MGEKIIQYVKNALNREYVNSYIYKALSSKGSENHDEMVSVNTWSSIWESVIKSSVEPYLIATAGMRVSLRIFSLFPIVSIVLPEYRRKIFEINSVKCVPPGEAKPLAE